MKEITIKELKLGDGVTKVCVSVAESELSLLLESAEKAIENGADLIEWRADFYPADADTKEGKTALLQAATVLRESIGHAPLLFTFRTFEEGGVRQVSAKTYETLLRFVIEEKLADLLDVEYHNGSSASLHLVTQAERAGTPVILSTHDFQKTPTEEELLSCFEGMQRTEATLTKMAVMPLEIEDVYRLLKVAMLMKTEKADRPFVAISMGEEGAISRIGAEHFGSAITFGAGKEVSAPGQIPSKILKGILERTRRDGLPKRIFLIGFMGCGKSTIGKQLSLLLGYEFVDMDAVIESRAQMPISRIFEMEGEPVFRKAEQELLKELATRECVVVACGGGLVGNTLTSGENRAILGSEAAVVYLREPIETLFGRIAHDKGRPLVCSDLRSRDEQFERLAELYQTRKTEYEQAATHLVDGNGKEPIELAVTLFNLLFT